MYPCTHVPMHLPLLLLLLLQHDHGSPGLTMAAFPFLAARPLPAYQGVCGGGGSPGRRKGVVSDAVLALAAMPCLGLG